jgi:uncharacterized protein YjbJ (UPF0337 family)
MLSRLRRDGITARSHDAPKKCRNSPAHRGLPIINLKRKFPMDKDRTKGAADQAKGSIKEAAGKVSGDTKLRTEGSLDKAKGKVESAVGGAKDAVRDAHK